MTNNRDFLFIYSGVFCQPNGDPATKEQRLDTATGELLVSGVRIKRYIRDFWNTYSKKLIYMLYDERTKAFAKSMTAAEQTGSGSSARVAFMEKSLKVEDIFDECIDVRLFGGISTVKKQNRQQNGAMQIATLNPSMHTMRTIDMSNSTSFPSIITNDQGSFSSLNLVPYFVELITGQFNGAVADINKVREGDLASMYGAMWLSLDTQSSVTKQGQHPLLLVDIEYNRISRLTTLRNLITFKHEAQTPAALRENTPQSFDLTALLALQSKQSVSKVNYYTEDAELLAQLEKAGSKFSPMTLDYDTYELR